MRCDQCRYWRNQWEESVGQCRRHGPTSPLMVMTTQEHRFQEPKGEWPLTRNDDWCGDFESKEPPHG